MSSPLLASVTMGAGVGVVAAASALGLPLPPCPLHAVTGVPCPGCGAARSISAVVDGDLTLAVDFNALVPLALMVIAWSGIAAAFRRAGLGLWDPLRASRATVVVGYSIGLFWVLRLMPWGPTAWLAP